MSVRVLVVEDEFMIGLDIKELLAEAGFEVVGPALSVAKALRFMAEPGCDVAVLDVNLGSETSGPVARKLRASGTPFVVVTGYSTDNLPSWYHDAIVVMKPYSIDDLVAALRKCADAMPNTSNAVGSWLLLDEKLDRIGDDLSSPVQASLESILRTEQLSCRVSRPPDHETENSALIALVRALADSPRTILQKLADKVLEVLHADSAGLSLLTKDEKRFYWAAISGAWRPHIGRGTPRNFGPCGDVLDRNIPMLFTHWERRYPYLGTATPLADEGLLVPFYVNGKAVGTIWAIAHNSHREFDAEDLRLLDAMGRFASAAYQTVQSIEDLKLEIAAREKAEGELRELTGGLEEQVRFRAEELGQRNRQLADAMSELTQQNRIAMAGELSATIAHEVNQPLTGMVLKASAAMRLLRAETPDLDKVRDLLSGIVNAGHHASDVVRSVRAMFRKDMQEKIEIDINKVIRCVLGLVHMDLRNQGIEIHPNLSEHLPPVIGHEIQLQQVILNLVTNAIESMRSTEPRVLSVESELRGRNRVRVSIEDTGSGIEPSNVERIFKPLFTTKAHGMGVGLSICRSIIESHQGRIWASAGASRGSIFHFELPTKTGESRTIQ